MLSRPPCVILFFFYFFAENCFQLFPHLDKLIILTALFSFDALCWYNRPMHATTTGRQASEGIEKAVWYV